MSSTRHHVYTKVTIKCRWCRLVHAGEAAVTDDGRLLPLLPPGWVIDEGDPRRGGGPSGTQRHRMCGSCGEKLIRALAAGGKAVLDYYDREAKGPPRIPLCGDPVSR